MFLGTDYLKFVVFIMLGLILMDLFFSGKTSIIRKFRKLCSLACIDRCHIATNAHFHHLFHRHILTFCQY
jgi:hypothetical protein